MSESFTPSPCKQRLLNEDMKGEADPVVKRLKLENADDKPTSPNFLPTPTRFLSFHLQLLRALYNNDNNNDNDNNESSETNVGEITWEMTARYLQQRETIKSMTQIANHCSGIHKEALHVLDQEPALSPAWATRDIIPPPPPPSSSMNSTLLTGTTSTTQHSPHTPRYPTQQQTGSTSSLQRGSDNNNNSSHQSFRVVASLLGRKSQMATARLQQQIKPFRPLLTAVEQRLALLDQLARQQQQTALQHQNQHIASLVLRSSTVCSTETQVAGNVVLGVQEDDNMDESLARIETKRRLWSILLQDLKHCA